MGGQNASIVAVQGERADKGWRDAECWQDKPAKRRQKDVEARWTKKHGRSHYGWSTWTVGTSLRRYQVSDAATHDSKVLDDILDGDHGLGRMGGQRLPLGGDRRPR